MNGFKKIVKELLDLEFIIFIIILLAIRWSVLGNYKVPTESMVPTIEVGDRLFANKLAYSLMVPFRDTTLIRWKTPERGDIIAFRNPNNEKEMFTKRVIGLPGDKIEIRNKKLYINDKEIPTQFASFVKEIEYVDPANGKLKVITDKLVKNKFTDNKSLEIKDDTVYINGVKIPDSNIKSVKDFIYNYEKLGDVTHLIRNYTRSNPMENADNYSIIVEPGFYFAMGDNRDESFDSRFWGLLDVNNIEGKLIFRWWAFKDKTFSPDFRKIGLIR
ncbi:MAG: signal peptidase I [Spirochaetes bacterium]|nr:signal peptidase I [Spirochaetota bacterium]